MAITCPNIAEDMENDLLGEFEEITFVKVIPYEEKVLVGMMTTPFFSRSEKMNFSDRVAGYISSKYNISKYDIFITFNIGNIYDMKNVENKEDIKNLINKVCSK